MFREEDHNLLWFEIFFPGNCLDIYKTVARCCIICITLEPVIYDLEIRVFLFLRTFLLIWGL